MDREDGREVTGQMFKLFGASLLFSVPLVLALQHFHPAAKSWVADKLGSTFNISSEVPQVIVPASDAQTRIILAPQNY